MDDHHSDDAHGHGTPATGRTTSPMQSFTTREVGIGFAVLLVGLFVVFGVPLLF